MTLEPAAKQCTACGKEHEREGELCPRCQEQTAREYDDYTRRP